MRTLLLLGAALLWLATAGADAAESKTLEVRNAHGTMRYDLFVPSSYVPTGPAVPLVVSLHGGYEPTSSTAQYSGWNVLAEQHGFVVAYPRVVPEEGQRPIWNWSSVARKERDDRNASLIALVTTSVATSHHIDRGRVLLAGISAGGGMAVAVGIVYPELFTAVGVEAGCAYGYWRCWDLPCSWTSCEDKAWSSLFFRGESSAAGAHRAMGPRARRLPAILSYGADDWLSTAVGQDALLTMWLALNDWNDDGAENASVPRQAAQVIDGKGNGADYARSVYLDATRCPLVETWIVKGLDHRYSGARYADGKTGPGPDMRLAQYEFLLAQAALQPPCGKAATATASAPAP
ncbi:MAG TPA: PHB depolymerase family esterase [Nevskiaceae bacterium]|nr:PHB depolymerase family esterase [Nevskiaceae bacterium]